MLPAWQSLRHALAHRFIFTRYSSTLSDTIWTNTGRRTAMPAELYAVAKQYAESDDATGGIVELKRNEEHQMAELCIRNPQLRNAFDGSMMLQLESAVTQLEDMQSELKLVVCHSDGDDFCSGGDLNFVTQIATPELGRQMSVFMTAVLERFRCLEALTLCYIQGKALGGGAELTTACDMRVMSRIAEVRFVQARLHVTTGWGGGSRLRNLLGEQRALYYLTSAHGITHNIGGRLGFSDLSVQREDGRTMSIMWALDFLQNRTLSVVHDCKRLIVGSHDARMRMQALYAMETELFARHWGSEEHRQMLDEREATRAGSVDSAGGPHNMPAA